MNIAVCCALNKQACQGPMPWGIWLILGVLIVATVVFCWWAVRK